MICLKMTWNHPYQGCVCGDIGKICQLCGINSLTSCVCQEPFPAIACFCSLCYRWDFMLFLLILESASDGYYCLLKRHFCFHYVAGKLLRSPYSLGSWRVCLCFTHLGKQKLSRTTRFSSFFYLLGPGNPLFHLKRSDCWYLHCHSQLWCFQRVIGH